MDQAVAIAFDNLPLLLSGLWVTLQLTALAFGLAVVLGTLGAACRTVPFTPLNWLGATYVEFFRNTPLLVQMFFAFFALPAVGISLPGFVAAFIALGVYTGAFMTEAIRAGILAVNRGQVEAARSLGLGYLPTMRWVVLPQAFAITVPPVGSLTSAMVRNSSIASAIAVPELLYQARVLESRTFATYPIFITTGLLYLVLTAPIGWGVNWLERRLGRYRTA
ncbi:MAG: amino acid ABC transporter permease [Dehalococcoidia bacterium]